MKKLLFGLLGLLFSISAHALPAGYTELQYIESTGTQYIDTGVGLNSVNKITGKIAFTNLDGNLSYIAGGRRSDNVAVGYALFSAAHGGFSIYNTTWPDQGVNISINQILEFETFMGSEQQSFIVNGNTILTGDKSISLDSRNVCLFGLGSEYLALAKMYSLKMYNNNTLVRDFIPARRDDGVLGMYDTVGGRFYINAGSGSFAAGPIACDGTIVNYTSATGTVTQNGTPTPTNPIEPVFYTQGDMVLRKVGDYADTYDASTGKITRRIGVKVFNGSESCSRFSNSLNVIVCDRIIDSNGSSIGLSNAFSRDHTGTSSLLPGEFFSGNTNSKKNIYFNYGEWTDTKLAEFKQYLTDQYNAGRPVVVYYQLAEAVEETVPASYCQQAIKIASTKYVETQFSDLGTRLAAAVATVNTVVTNTITQAASIATLQSGKQTRPADDTCPAYKQCLLVEDENGTPHWYQITDPFRDFVAPIIANNVAPASSTSTRGYTQLEYIESTRTQWIDTGVYLSSNHAVEFVANGVGDFFGTRSSTTSASFGVTGGSTLDMYASTSEINAGGRFHLENTVSTTKYIYHIESGNKWMKNADDGTVLGRSTYVPNAFTISEYTAPIFNIAWSAPASERTPSKGKLYSFKIWENGTLVRNFVPVVENTTGKVGIYDTVGGRFYGNAATSGADFTPGPIVDNDADVPGMTWSATWAANATTGVSAGTVYGEALCNAVIGTQDLAATSTQTSSANWSNSGAGCWCYMTGLDDGNGINTKENSVYFYRYGYSSGDECRSTCVASCSLVVQQYESIRNRFLKAWM